MTRKIAISAMNWHSLSAAEKVTLAAIGIGCENSVVEKQPLPIRVIESALGCISHNHPGQYQDIVLTPAKDKEDAEKRLQLLEETNSGFAARINALFVSFLNGCMAIDYMSAPIILIANRTYNFAFLGLVDGLETSGELFGTKELRTYTELGEYSKLKKDMSWDMDPMTTSHKVFYRHTQNSAMAERLMHFSDIADAIAAHTP